MATTGRTGETCQESGIYKAGCNCNYEIALSKDETFPPCGSCNKAVIWTLVRKTK